MSADDGRAARRNLTFGEIESHPMTPARPAPEGLDTPTKIAEAADEYLIGRNLTVPSGVYAVQSTMGKKWTLNGREKDKRADFGSGSVGN